MLLRSYAKTNGLKADEVMGTLKQQYPQRQWVGSSKLSPNEIRELNSQFGIGEQLPTLPEATELPQEPVEPPQAESEEMRSQQEPPEKPQKESQPAGQIQQAPQQLPQAQQSPSEMAQTMQYLLAQQQSLGYSNGLNIDSAAKEGAIDAYREFITYQQSYGATSEGLRHLKTTLDEIRNNGTTNGFDQAQKDFLLTLQTNSRKSQESLEQRHQQQQKAQTTQNTIGSLNSTVLSAINDLKNKTA